MAPPEDKAYVALVMDRAEPVGNSEDSFGRRALHAKIANKATEPIPVVITDDVPLNELFRNIYAEANAVPSGAQTDIVTYIVPLHVSFHLRMIEAAGTNIAEYRVLINGDTVSKQFTYFGNPLTAAFDYASGSDGGWKLPAGTVIKVSVKHLRPYAGDFSARIVGVERDE